MGRRWRVGTRRSALARAQASAVGRWLAEHSGDPVELVEMTTAGDRLQEQNPAAAGRGAFVKELDAALLEGRVDLCVHSAKDVPPELPQGLRVAAFPPRADPRDALVAAPGWTLAGMPLRTTVGTGSPRRAVQLLHWRPDLRVVPVRGNVDSRLARQRRGDLDALVLAAAGLDRLGMGEAAVERLDPSRLVPAAGQGALAVMVRADDGALAALLAPLDHPPTAVAVLAERAVLEALGGDCSAPAGAYAVAHGGALHLQAMLGGPRSGRVVRVAVEADWTPGAPLDRGEVATWAAALGRRAAADLMQAGGAALMAEAAPGEGEGARGGGDTVDGGA
jgi:hydroxymethylbilane synthase